MNCVENLPVYTAIVVCATVARVTGPILDVLALTLLAARIFQTATHVTFRQTDRVASMRFAFFFVQILCMSAMAGFILVSPAHS
jgi:hypothetical protein